MVNGKFIGKNTEKDAYGKPLNNHIYICIYNIYTYTYTHIYVHINALKIP